MGASGKRDVALMSLKLPFEDVLAALLAAAVPAADV